MPTLKERVENNLAVFFLSALLVGFLAGIAAYEGILKISGRETISSEEKRELEVKSKEESKQLTLRIDGVDFPEGSEEHSVRVVAEVDGFSYSYPTRAIWADIGPRMSREEFPLPVGLDKFRIRFTVFLRDPSGQKSQLVNQEAHEVVVSTLPMERNYELFPSSPSFTRAPKAVLQVKYSIR